MPASSTMGALAMQQLLAQLAADIHALGGVALAVVNDHLELVAVDAAVGVDLVHGHLHGGLIGGAEFGVCAIQGSDQAKADGSFAFSAFRKGADTAKKCQGNGQKQCKGSFHEDASFVLFLWTQLKQSRP